jgi:dienelactone hydrolase
LRPFETYLAIGCVAAILWPALFGVRPRRGIVAVTLVVLLVVQLQTEGYRWPLLPLYLVAIGLAVGDFVTLERGLPWARRAGRALFGPLGLAAALAPALLFPVPRLPVPSGPLAIGTQTVELAHAELREQYGPSPGVRRSIKTQVWYPAHPAEGSRPIPWHPDVEVVGSALAGRLGLPGFFFNSARHTVSHAHADAPVDEGGFPLVVFSHGWEGFRTIALGQIENLVSQGYVVIAIDHPYGAVATVIGGEPVYLDDEALGEPDADDIARREAEAALIDTFAADIGLVLDEVDKGEEGMFGDLAAAIDEEAVGIWGQGVGGGAALQVCLTDERCDAVVGQDPRVEWLPDPVLANTAVRPMLLMRSDPWRDTPNDAVLRGIVARSGTITYWVGVLGADSSDFGVAPLVSPIASELGLRGPIDGSRVMIINRRFLTGFFDRFLLGTGTAALDTVDFPEVDVELVDRR